MIWAFLVLLFVGGPILAVVIMVKMGKAVVRDVKKEWERDDDRG